MVVDKHSIFGQIKLSAFYLSVSGLTGVQLKLLGHLVDNGLNLRMMIIPHNNRLLLFGSFRIKSNRSISQFVITAFIELKSLAPNSLFSVN